MKRKDVRTLGVRRVGIVSGEVELWAYADEDHALVAQDGQTPEEAVQKLKEAYPRFFAGYSTEMFREPVLPPKVKCNY